jgi:hypothetical protein
MGVVLLFTSVALAKATIPGFTEKVRPLLDRNHHDESTVEFDIVPEDTVFDIVNGALADGDDAVSIAATIGADSPSLMFRIKTIGVAGDSSLCDAVVATLPLREGTSTVSSLDAPLFDSNDPSAVMRFILHGTPFLEAGMSCVVNLSIMGWDEQRTPFLEKYRAEEFIGLEFRVVPVSEEATTEGSAGETPPTQDMPVIEIVTGSSTGSGEGEEGSGSESASSTVITEIRTSTEPPPPNATSTSESSEVSEETPLTPESNEEISRDETVVTQATSTTADAVEEQGSDA